MAQYRGFEVKKIERCGAVYYVIVGDYKKYSGEKQLYKTIKETHRVIDNRLA